MIFGPQHKRSLRRNLSKQGSYIIRIACWILQQYYRECQNNYLVKSLKILIKAVKIFAKLIGQFRFKGDSTVWLGTILKCFSELIMLRIVLLCAFGLPSITQLSLQVLVVYVPENILGWPSGFVAFILELTKMKHSALEMLALLLEWCKWLCKIYSISNKLSGKPKSFS